jgi:hypothetical protein
VASPLITLAVFPEDPQRKMHLKNLCHLLHRTYSHGLWSVAQTLSLPSCTCSLLVFIAVSRAIDLATRPHSAPMLLFVAISGLRPSCQ